MHWIKLTFANDAGIVWVNLAECGMIQPDPSGGCHIFTKRTGPMHVRQSVEQVLSAKPYGG